MKLRQILVETVIILLALHFFYIGISKFIEFTYYKAWIYNQPLIKQLGPILSLSIPILELAICFGLLTRKLRHLTLYIVIICELILILWVMLVFSKNQYVFSPYDAYWKNPTWLGKISEALIIAWIAFSLNRNAIFNYKLKKTPNTKRSTVH